MLVVSCVSGLICVWMVYGQLLLGFYYLVWVVLAVWFGLVVGDICGGYLV